MRKFHRSFTQQESLDEHAVNAAIAVLRHGRLHRYNVIEGEISETSRLEQEFAKYVGTRYCLAVASGGYAISCALRAVGVQRDDKVLTNAFTLAPVPGAIDSVGARSVLVEIGGDLTIDFADLEQKARTSGASVLVLSHMRGHICDMNELVALCTRLHLILIEDCAHTMGAFWQGVPSGRHGIVSCFSTQTYKHMNSGEGGLLVTNSDDIMAKAIVLAGSYMLFDRHLARPDLGCFDDIKMQIPNCSGRMDNLRAAILRPQLVQLDKQCERWNKRYRAIAEQLSRSPWISITDRRAGERFVGSSIQFFVEFDTPQDIREFLRLCRFRGVELKWFGAEQPEGYTSRFDSWKYLDHQECPQTMKILKNLMDMRIPLTFTVADCRLVAEIIVDSVRMLKN